MGSIGFLSKRTNGASTRGNLDATQRRHLVGHLFGRARSSCRRAHMLLDIDVAGIAERESGLDPVRRHTRGRDRRVWIDERTRADLAAQAIPPAHRLALGCRGPLIAGASDRVERITVLVAPVMEAEVPRVRTLRPLPSRTSASLANAVVRPFWHRHFLPSTRWALRTILQRSSLGLL
jgi:hypothetical protein